MATLEKRSVADQAVAALLAEALVPLGTRPVIRPTRWGHTKRWRVFWTRDDCPGHHRRWIQPAFWSLTLRGPHLTWETVSAHGRHQARFAWSVDWLTWDLVDGAESIDAWFDRARSGWAAWLNRVPPPVPSDAMARWPRWAWSFWAGSGIISAGLVTIGLWHHVGLATLYGGIFGVIAIGGVVERVTIRLWLPSVWVPDAVPSAVREHDGASLSAIAAEWALADPEKPQRQLWDELSDILQLEPYAEALRLRHRDSGFSMVWHTDLPRRHDRLIPRVVFHWADPYTVMVYYDRSGAVYDASHDTWEFNYDDQSYRILHWSGSDWLTENGESWHVTVRPGMMAHLTTWPWIHDPTPAEREQYRRGVRNNWIQRLAVISGFSALGALVGSAPAAGLMKALGWHPLAINSVNGAIGGAFLALMLMLALFHSVD